MSGEILTFLRTEKKYIINDYQKEELMKIFDEYMELDKYCLNNQTYHIQNIYYDTERDALINRSLEKPMYKEKLRARKYYGTKYCFLEIKKKFDGVVGKRRIILSLDELDNVMNGRPIKERDNYSDRQILKEIQNVLSRYKLKPKVFISYDRLGYFSKVDPSLRVTFDDNLHAKRNNFEWDKDDYETDILPKGMYVLEIKSSHNFPLWLVRALSNLKIYTHSFSKYGTEFVKYKGKDF